jgi:hypothetical protein
MKTKKLAIVAAASLMLMSCGTDSLSMLGGVLGAQPGNQTSTQNSATGSILGDIFSAATSGQTVGNVLTGVLGLDKMTQKDLIGTWKYSSPGCAFTSQQLLAQAGGEVVATQIKTKLQPTFNTVGINSSNTYVTFNQDGTFTASIAGKQWSGKYTYDAATSKVTMQGLLLNVNCYAKKNASGIGLLFEASKLLTVLKTMSALSGNTSLQTIGDLAGNYDGVRIGFDMK